MILQTISRRAASYSRGRRVAAWTAILFGIGALIIPGAVGQSAPEIDSSSIRIEAGPAFTFQFRGPGQGTVAFTVETAAELAAPVTWGPAPGAVVTSVADGLFRVTVSMQTDRFFFRVRALDSGASSPPLFINEVMSDNETALDGGGGTFWDWIEIYNPNDEAVNLLGYALTDDEAVPGKWRFPGLLFQPHAHLLLYASDLNQTNLATPLHTNFRLSPAGETLILADAALRPLDRVAVPALAPDQSVGRTPDGGSEFLIYGKSEASPGRANGGSTNGPAVLSPRFTPDGGFFDGPVSVEIHGAESGHVVHYTLDGSAPRPDSPVLTSALSVDKSTVVRAIAVTSQGQISAPEARTFFIGVKHDLPIVSLATDPGYLDFRDGYLYGMGPRVLSSENEVLQGYPFPGSNAWQDREVEIALEFFETNRVVGLRQRAGMKIFGGWGSKGYPQKSLALFARRSYGAGKFDYPVFPEQGVKEFEALVLRNSGNDNQSTHQTAPRPPITEFGPTQGYGSYFVNGTFTLMRDALMQRLVEETDLDTQAYRPAAVYINGEYWGLYNLREKMNEAYVLSHHGLAPGSVDLIEGYGAANAGNGNAYYEMVQETSNRDLADDANYAFLVENFVDVGNFIDYHLAVIYFQNFDIGNIKCWRPQAARGRFRWMLFDQDYGFNLWPAAVYLPAMARDFSDYDNMFDFYTAANGTSVGWPNEGGRTLLLRKFLSNAHFKEQFIRRCADLLNSQFREDKVEQTIQQMAAVIRPEIPGHLQRWSWSELTKRGFGKPHQAEYQPFTQATWETNLTVLSDFARNRPAKLRQDCLEHFQLQGGVGSLQIQIQPEGSGRILVNTLSVSQSPWQGVYFADVANVLRPIPNPGYRFVEWLTPNGNANGNSLDFKVQRDSVSTVTARMESAPANPGTPSELIISEIQYHPAAGRDSGDWVELSNPGSAALKLTGWVFRDEDDQHGFPLPDVTLEAGASLVLCQDDSKFRTFHPASVASVGDFRFGLSNGGGSLRLFRPDGTVASAIVYDDAAPWPTAADGGGATLELVDPQADPNLPDSWKASSEPGGTPGRR